MCWLVHSLDGDVCNVIANLLRLIRAKLEQLPRPCRVFTYLYKFPGALQHDAKHFLRAKDSSDEVAFPVYVYSFPTALQCATATAVRDTCVSAL